MPSRKLIYTAGGVVTALVIIIIIAISVGHKSEPPPPGPSPPSTPDLKRVKGPFELPKAPHWDNATQSLFFVDVYNASIHKYTPASDKLVTASVGMGPMAFVIPINGTADQFIVSAGPELGIVQWDGIANNVTYTTWATIGKDVYRANEGKVSPSGSLFVGGHSPFEAGKPTEVDLKKAALYVFRKDKTSEILLKNVSVANGMAWSKNETTFYFIDSMEFTVSAYKYDKSTDHLSDGVVLLNFTEKGIPGVPDGMTIDSEDKLWITSFRGARILHFDPDSRTILKTIELKAYEVTSVLFGGSNLDSMYVTTGRYQMDDATLTKYPDSGFIFEQKKSVLGRPSTPFSIN